MVFTDGTRLIGGRRAILCAMTASSGRQPAPRGGQDSAASPDPGDSPSVSAGRSNGSDTSGPGRSSTTSTARSSRVRGPRDRIPATGAVAGICPFLLDADGGWRSASASKDHRCGAIDPPARLAIDKQERLCLVTAHVDCPAYGAATGTTETRPAAIEARPVPRTAPIVLEPARQRPRLPGLPAAASGRGSAMGLRPAQIGLAALMIVALALVALVRFGGDRPAALAGGSPSPSAAASGASGAPHASAVAGASGAPKSSASPKASSVAGRPTAAPARTPQPSSAPQSSTAPTAQPSSGPVATSPTPTPAATSQAQDLSRQIRRHPLLDRRQVRYDRQDPGAAEPHHGSAHPPRRPGPDPPVNPGSDGVGHLRGARAGGVGDLRLRPRRASAGHRGGCRFRRRLFATAGSLGNRT